MLDIPADAGQSFGVFDLVGSALKAIRESLPTK
jgi:hypothetical protein